MQGAVYWVSFYAIAPLPVRLGLPCAGRWTPNDIALRIKPFVLRAPGQSACGGG